MREMIKEGIERILASRVTPAVLHRSWHGQWDGELWQTLEENGFTRAICRTDSDGAGASWSDIYPLVVACGYYQLPLPLPEAILANRLLEDAGIAHPGGLVGIADKGGGIPTAMEATTAGIVPWGGNCAYVLSLWQDAPNTLALFAVEDVTLEPGSNLAREPRNLLLLGNAQPVAQGYLENAAAKIRCYGARIRAAQAAGAAQSAMEQTIQYAGDRVQFGNPLAKFQAVQQQIASAVSELAALNAASEYAFSATESTLSWSAAIAKITASEAGSVVSTVAHAVHGAIGYTVEHRLHYATQRLRSWNSEFGNHRWWCERLGRRICRDGVDPLIPAIVDGSLEPLD